MVELRIQKKRIRQVYNQDEEDQLTQKDNCSVFVQDHHKGKPNDRCQLDKFFVYHLEMDQFYFGTMCQTHKIALYHQFYFIEMKKKILIL